MPEPVRLHSHIGNADESADWTMEGSSGDDLLRERDLVIRMQIEVEYFFPHRRNVNKVPLLAQVLLCDLQLDRFVRLLEPAEQRRDGLTHLKVNRAVLDLDHDVVVELSVERMKVVVSSLRAIVLQICPIEMMVVDKGAIEDD